MNPKIYPILLTLFLTLLPVSTLAREKLPMKDLEIVEQRWPEAIRTFTSLRYIIMEPGEVDGPKPVSGSMVKVSYKGMLLDGTVFDESGPDKPLVVRVDRGGLISGWDEALQKMHKGEKWLLIVPPEMAYGARGRPPSIKRDATLIFEMKLLDFGPDLK